MLSGTSRIARRALLAACLLLVGAGGASADTKLIHTPLRFGLFNEFLRFEMPRDKSGGVHFGTLTNRITGQEFSLEGWGPRIYLGDGSVLSLADFGGSMAENREESGTNPAPTLAFSLVSASQELEVILVLQLGHNDPFLRVHLDIATASMDQMAQVDRLDLLAGPAFGSVEGGGRGFPLIVDGQMYLGVEFAAADNVVEDGSVYLRTLPGQRLVAEESVWGSHDAIVGVAAAGGAVRGFVEQYLPTVGAARIRRAGAVPGSVLVYNTLYDLRGEGANSELLIRDVAAIRAALRSWNASLGFALLEDFWYEPKSLWGFHLVRFPSGLADFQSDPATRDVRAALGISFSGAGLDPTWLGQQGYAFAGGASHPCLTSPKYKEDLGQRLLNVTRNSDVGMFLHRDLQIDCRENAEGEPTDADHGLYANLDAFQAILDDPQTGRAEYQLLSPAPWPSPWWLTHMDAIRVGAPPETQQFDWSQPAPQPRDAAMTYNDALVHGQLAAMRGLVSPADLLSPGLVKARFAPVDAGRVALDRWMDDVVLNAARGSRIRQLYLSPDLVSREEWALLGRGLAWADAEEHFLQRSRWIGGDPSRGEVYGMIVQEGPRTVFILRNPKMAADRFSIHLGDDLGYGPGRFWAWSEYPNRQRVHDRLSRSSTLEIPLAGLETRVVEIGGAMSQTLLARGFWNQPAPAAPAIVMSTGGIVPARPATSASAQLTVDAGGRAGLALLFQGAARASDAYTTYVYLNGETVSSTGELSGPDWQMLFYPLPDGAQDVRLHLEEKSGSGGGKVELSLWGLVPGMDHALVEKALAERSKAERRYLPVVRRVGEYPVTPLVGPVNLRG